MSSSKNVHRLEEVICVPSITGSDADTHQSTKCVQAICNWSRPTEMSLGEEANYEEEFRGVDDIDGQIHKFTHMVSTWPNECHAVTLPSCITKRFLACC